MKKSKKPEFTAKEIQELTRELKKNPPLEKWEPTDIGPYKVQRISACDVTSTKLSLLATNEDGTEDLYAEEKNGIIFIQTGRKPDTHWLDDSGMSFMCWKD